LRKTQTIHLHWGFHRPKLLAETTKGMSLCGVRDLPRDEMTAFKDDATCKVCLQKEKGDATN